MKVSSTKDGRLEKQPGATLGYENKLNEKRLLSDAILGILKSFPLSLHPGRDNGNDFSFPVPSPFLKLNDNDVKSFLNRYPIF